jgi:hypothetical protein
VLTEPPISLEQIKGQWSLRPPEKNFSPARSPLSRSAAFWHREPPCDLRSCAFSTSLSADHVQETRRQAGQENRQTCQQGTAGEESGRRCLACEVHQVAGTGTQAERTGRRSETEEGVMRDRRRNLILADASGSSALRVEQLFQRLLRPPVNPRRRVVNEQTLQHCPLLSTCALAHMRVSVASQLVPAFAAGLPPRTNVGVCTCIRRSS